MSLWGTNDSKASGGTIKINLATLVITGSGTSFSTAGVSEGDVIQIGAGQTYGEATIASVSSNTVASIASTDFITPHTATGITTVHASAAINIDSRPISSIWDTNYDSAEIFGVDTTEQSVANAGDYSTGLQGRKFAPPHAGWVGIQTYTDMHGNLRVKTETLVASSSIEGDAADDVKFEDS